MQNTIVWDANTEPDLAGYHVYRDGGTTPYEGSEPLFAPVFFDMNVTLGQTYTYQVTAYDTSGNESAKSNLLTIVGNVDNQPPSQPQNLAVVLF